MTEEIKRQYLPIALYTIGGLFICTIYLLFQQLDIWNFTGVTSYYKQLIVGMFATLGVFLLLAAKQPSEHRSIIAFTVWLTGVLATIALLHSILDPEESNYRSVVALYLITIVLGYLMPAKRN